MSNLKGRKREGDGMVEYNNAKKTKLLTDERFEANIILAETLM